MGILMNRRQVTAGQAFQMLVRASQHLSRKLRDVAQDVARTGRDPGSLEGDSGREAWAEHRERRLLVLGRTLNHRG
jgi:hypothetical protein